MWEPFIGEPSSRPDGLKAGVELLYELNKAWLSWGRGAGVDRTTEFQHQQVQEGQGRGGNSVLLPHQAGTSLLQRAGDTGEGRPSSEGIMRRRAASRPDLRKLANQEVSLTPSPIATPRLHGSKFRAEMSFLLLLCLLFGSGFSFPQDRFPSLKYCGVPPGDAPLHLGAAP